MRKFFIGRAVGFIVLLFIIGILLGIQLLTDRGIHTHPPVESYRTSLTGVQVCLPHKDSTGPQTLECAQGIKTEDGDYYALDFSLMSQIPAEIEVGNTFTATGLVTPIELLSSDHWQMYDIQGIFSVTDSLIVYTETLAPVSATFSWSFEKAATLNLDGNQNTEVVLLVVYGDGRTEEKVIETVPGGCNELPDHDSEALKGTFSVQCYYAGFGERFRIVMGEHAYQVERQEFEEGSPEHNPPIKSYEVVAEFPF